MVAAAPRKARLTNLYFAWQICARFLMFRRYSALMKSSEISPDNLSPFTWGSLHAPQNRLEPPDLVRGKITSTVQAMEKHAAAANTSDKSQAGDQDAGWLRKSRTLPWSLE